MFTLESTARRSVLSRVASRLAAWLRGYVASFDWAEAEEEYVHVVRDGSERAMRHRLAAGQRDERLSSDIAFDYWGERYVEFGVQESAGVAFCAYLDQPFHYELIVAKRWVERDRRLREGGLLSARADLYRN